MAGSVRDYAILWVGAGKGGGVGTALGGNALLTTTPHKLDGAEHLAADDGTRLDASTDRHGLLPKLSGDATDVLLGDGTFGTVPARALIWRQVFALDPSSGNYVPVTADGQGVIVEA